MSDAPHYFLEGNPVDVERARLQLLERLAGPWTEASLGMLGDLSGKRCLELGGGGGGVARWLADAVGEDGSVVVVDRDTRFLDDLPANVELREADLETFEPDGPFDLVHARAVLVYVPSREQILERAVASLAPGGWMALEEPVVFMNREFNEAASGEAIEDGDALGKLFELGQMDIVRFPLRLPFALEDLGLIDVTWDTHVAMSRGGEGWALFNEWTVADVAAPMAVSLGLASPEFPDRLREQMRNPSEPVLSPMLVAVRGRLP
jgi:SAM-dependent methyltransferase